MTPATKPAGGESQGSQRGGIFGARPVALRVTKIRTKSPRMSVAARGDSSVSTRVPSTMADPAREQQAAEPSHDGQRGPASRELDAVHDDVGKDEEHHTGQPQNPHR